MHLHLLRWSHVERDKPRQPRERVHMVVAPPITRRHLLLLLAAGAAAGCSLVVTTTAASSPYDSTLAPYLSLSLHSRRGTFLHSKQGIPGIHISNILDVVGQIVGRARVCLVRLVTSAAF